MKTLKKLLAVILCVSLMMQLCITSFASYSYYEATKDAKVYTQPYKDSKHKYTVSKGKLVKVTSYVVNSYDNLWYKLDDGYYTYSGNYKSHNHVAVMCGMPSTSYERNNSSSHIKVYYSGDELCSCGHVVAKGSTSRTNESHSFNSSGKCSKCGYAKPATTVHTHQAVMCGQPSTSYERNNSSSHIKVYYSGDELCSCGYVVAKGSTSRTNESHSFNSSGKCSKCGYAKPATTAHTHQAVMCGQPSTSYERNNSSSHIKVFYSGDELCSCGYVVAKGSTSRTNESHSFNSSGKCSKCGYTRPATTVHTHKASMCGQPSTSYEYLNESIHIKVLYAGDELCSCGHVVARGSTSRTNESHSFNSSGKCSKCGYIKETTTAHIHIPVMCGQSSTSYEKYDSIYHTKIFYSGDEICSCGFVVKSGNTTRTTENHSFNSKGVCSTCKYVKKDTTAHEHEAVMCGQPYSYYNQLDSEYHVNVYCNGDEFCSCGYLVYKGNVSESNELHSFNSENRCTKCNYIKIESNIPTSHIHTFDKYGEPKYAYRQHDSDSTHILDYYYGDELCSCGYAIKEGPSVCRVEPHSFNANLLCTKCGFDNNVIVSEEEVINSNYITVKDKVPVRTFCKKAASIAYTIDKKGTPVTVSSLVVNQVGHIWAKTNDGYYIYLENLSEDVDNSNIITPMPSLDRCYSNQFKKGKLIESHIYCDNNKDTHSIIKHYEKICLSCGKTVYLNDSHIYSGTSLHTYIVEADAVPHSLDKNETCLQCGFNYKKYLEKQATLDKISVALTICGMIPVIGNIADALDLAASIARGEPVDIVASGISMIPGIGLLAGSAKAVDHITDISRTIDAIDNISSYQKMAHALENGADAASLIKNADNTDEILSVLKLSENPVAASKAGKKSARDALLESIENQSLKNTANDLYRPGAKTLDGGSADARRLELITGKPVGEKFHTQKVTDRINNLNKILRRDDLSKSDRLIAEALLKDLNKVLALEPR